MRRRSVALALGGALLGLRPAPADGLPQAGESELPAPTPAPVPLGPPRPDLARGDRGDGDADWVARRLAETEDCEGQTYDTMIVVTIFGRLGDEGRSSTEPETQAPGTPGERLDSLKKWLMLVLSRSIFDSEHHQAHQELSLEDIKDLSSEAIRVAPLEYDGLMKELAGKAELSLFERSHFVYRFRGLLGCMALEIARRLCDDAFGEGQPLVGAILRSLDVARMYPHEGVEAISEASNPYAKGFQVENSEVDWSSVIHINAFVKTPGGASRDEGRGHERCAAPASLGSASGFLLLQETCPPNSAHCADRDADFCTEEERGKGELFCKCGYGYEGEPGNPDRNAIGLGQKATGYNADACSRKLHYCKSPFDMVQAEAGEAASASGAMLGSVAVPSCPEGFKPAPAHSECQAVDHNGGRWVPEPECSMILPNLPPPSVCPSIGPGLEVTGDCECLDEQVTYMNYDGARPCTCGVQCPSEDKESSTRPGLTRGISGRVKDWVVGSDAGPKPVLAANGSFQEKTSVTCTHALVDCKRFGRLKFERYGEVELCVAEGDVGAKVPKFCCDEAWISSTGGDVSMLPPAELDVVTRCGQVRDLRSCLRSKEASSGLRPCCWSTGGWPIDGAPRCASRQDAQGALASGGAGAVSDDLGRQCAIERRVIEARFDAMPRCMGSCPKPVVTGAQVEGCEGCMVGDRSCRCVVTCDEGSGRVHLGGPSGQQLHCHLGGDGEPTFGAMPICALPPEAPDCKKEDLPAHLHLVWEEPFCVTAPGGKFCEARCAPGYGTSVLHHAAGQTNLLVCEVEEVQLDAGNCKAAQGAEQCLSRRSDSGHGSPCCYIEATKECLERGSAGITPSSLPRGFAAEMVAFEPLVGCALEKKASWAPLNASSTCKPLCDASTLPVQYRRPDMVRRSKQGVSCADCVRGERCDACNFKCPDGLVFHGGVGEGPLTCDVATGSFASQILVCRKEQPGESRASTEGRAPADCPEVPFAEKVKKWRKGCRVTCLDGKELDMELELRNISAEQRHVGRCDSLAARGDCLGGFEAGGTPCCWNQDGLTTGELETKCLPKGDARMQVAPTDCAKGWEYEFRLPKGQGCSSNCVFAAAHQRLRGKGLLETRDCDHCEPGKPCDCVAKCPAGFVLVGENFREDNGSAWRALPCADRGQWRNAEFTEVPLCVRDAGLSCPRLTATPMSKKEEFLPGVAWSDYFPTVDLSDCAPEDCALEECKCKVSCADGYLKTNSGSADGAVRCEAEDIVGLTRVGSCETGGDVTMYGCLSAYEVDRRTGAKVPCCYHGKGLDENATMTCLAKSSARIAKPPKACATLQQGAWRRGDFPMCKELCDTSLISGQDKVTTEGCHSCLADEKTAKECDCRVKCKAEFDKVIPPLQSKKRVPLGKDGFFAVQCLKVSQAKTKRSKGLLRSARKGAQNKLGLREKNGIEEIFQFAGPTCKKKSCDTPDLCPVPEKLPLGMQLTEGCKQSSTDPASRAASKSRMGANKCRVACKKGFQLLKWKAEDDAQGRVGRSDLLEYPLRSRKGAWVRKGDTGLVCGRSPRCPARPSWNEEEGSCSDPSSTDADVPDECCWESCQSEAPKKGTYFPVVTVFEPNLEDDSELRCSRFCPSKFVKTREYKIVGNCDDCLPEFPEDCKCSVACNEGRGFAQIGGVPGGERRCAAQGSMVASFADPPLCLSENLRCELPRVPNLVTSSECQDCQVNPLTKQTNCVDSFNRSTCKAACKSGYGPKGVVELPCVSYTKKLAATSACATLGSVTECMAHVEVVKGQQKRCCWHDDGMTRDKAKCAVEGSEDMLRAPMQCAALYGARFEGVVPCQRMCVNSLRASVVKADGCDGKLPGENCSVRCDGGADVIYAGGGALGERECSKQGDFGRPPFCIERPLGPMCGRYPEGPWESPASGCRCRAGEDCDCQAYCSEGRVEVRTQGKVKVVVRPGTNRQCVGEETPHVGSCEQHSGAREECLRAAEKGPQGLTPCCFQSARGNTSSRCLPRGSPDFDYAPSQCGTAAVGRWETPACEDACRLPQIPEEFLAMLDISEGCRYCTPGAACDCKIACRSGFDRFGAERSVNYECNKENLVFQGLPVCGRQEPRAGCPLFPETAERYPGPKKALAKYASYEVKTCVFGQMPFGGQCAVRCLGDRKEPQTVACKTADHRQKGPLDFWSSSDGRRGVLPAGGCERIDDEHLCLKAAEQRGGLYRPCCWRQSGFSAQGRTARCVSQAHEAISWSEHPDLVQRHFAGVDRKWSVQQFFKCTPMLEEGELKLTEARRLRCEPECRGQDLAASLDHRYTASAENCPVLGDMRGGRRDRHAAYRVLGNKAVVFDSRSEASRGAEQVFPSGRVLVEDIRADNGTMWGKVSTPKGWIRLFSEQARWAERVHGGASDICQATTKCKVGRTDGDERRFCLLDEVRNTAVFDEVPDCILGYSSLYPDNPGMASWTFQNQGFGTLLVSGCTNCDCAKRALAQECRCELRCAQGNFLVSGAEGAKQCRLVDTRPTFAGVGEKLGSASNNPLCLPRCDVPVFDKNFNPIEVSPECAQCQLNKACDGCTMSCQGGRAPVNDNGRSGKFLCAFKPGEHGKPATAYWKYAGPGGRDDLRPPQCGRPFEVTVVDAHSNMGILGAKVRLFSGADRTVLKEERTADENGYVKFVWEAPTATIQVGDTPKYFGTFRTVTRFSNRPAKISLQERDDGLSGKFVLPQRGSTDTRCLLRGQRFMVQVTLEWEGGPGYRDLDLWIRSNRCAESVAKRYECRGSEDEDGYFRSRGKLRDAAVDFITGGGPLCRKTDFVSLLVARAEAKVCGLYNTTIADAGGGSYKTTGLVQKDRDDMFGLLDNQYSKILSKHSRWMEDLHREWRDPFPWGADYPSKDAPAAKVPRTWAPASVAPSMRMTVDSSNFQGPESAKLTNLPPGRYQVLVNLNEKPASRVLQSARPLLTLRFGDSGVFQCRPIACNQKLWMAAEFKVMDDGPESSIVELVADEAMAAINHHEIPTLQGEVHQAPGARKRQRDNLKRRMRKVAGQKRTYSQFKEGMEKLPYTYWQTAAVWSATHWGPTQSLVEDACRGDCWRVVEDPRERGAQCFPSRYTLPLDATGRWESGAKGGVQLYGSSIRLFADGWNPNGDVELYITFKSGTHLRLFKSGNKMKLEGHHNFILAEARRLAGGADAATLSPWRFHGPDVPLELQLDMQHHEFGVSDERLAGTDLAFTTEFAVLSNRGDRDALLTERWKMKRGRLSAEAVDPQNDLYFRHVQAVQLRGFVNPYVEVIRRPTRPDHVRS